MGRGKIDPQTPPLEGVADARTAAEDKRLSMIPLR